VQDGPITVKLQTKGIPSLLQPNVVNVVVTDYLNNYVSLYLNQPLYLIGTDITLARLPPPFDTINGFYPVTSVQAGTLPGIVVLQVQSTAGLGVAYTGGGILGGTQITAVNNDPVNSGVKLTLTTEAASFGLINGSSAVVAGMYETTTAGSTYLSPICSNVYTLIVESPTSNQVTLIGAVFNASITYAGGLIGPVGALIGGVAPEDVYTERAQYALQLDVSISTGTLRTVMVIPPPV
jgi:hypothetical protein